MSVNTITKKIGERIVMNFLRSYKDQSVGYVFISVCLSVCMFVWLPVTNITDDGLTEF